MFTEHPVAVNLKYVFQHDKTETGTFVLSVAMVYFSSIRPRIFAQK